MPFQPRSEIEAYAGMLGEHLARLVDRLRRLPPDQWDWAPDPAAPTARIIAAHAWQWLQCDRQHILEPDASRHRRIPDPPSDPQAMCDALQEEAGHWRRMILALTPEQLAEGRFLFCHDDPLNVRALVCHMVKNVIYKHGQLAILYFALGLDGTEPYTPPLPNPEYEECFGPSAE
jgi:hypothetical protein